MTLANWAAPISTQYWAHRRLVLMFDYDGTLTPIVTHPNLATLSPPTCDILDELSSVDRVSVGVLSSRSLGCLKELVGLPRVWYAGSGGMHVDLNGDEYQDQALSQFNPIADALITAISPLLQWFPGTWVERKPGCLSIHYRTMSPLKAYCFVEEINKALAEVTAEGPALRIRDVTKTLEVSLASSWTKGNAVERMLDGLNATAFPVYVGDGANDEEAVATVNARRGVTVGIGPEPPKGVQFRVLSSAEFVVDLANLTANLSRRIPSSEAVRAGDKPRVVEMTNRL